MKGKNVFFALGLALTMGVGVAAAVAKTSEFKPAKAELTSWYVVGTFNSVNKWSHSTGYAMTETSTNVWTKTELEFKVGDEFKVCDEEDKNWQGGWSYNYGSSSNKSNFTAAADDANIVCAVAGTYDITFTKSDWHIQIEPSGAPTHTVAVYVDGVKRGDEVVTEGGLPASPELTEFGQGFNGWYSNSSCSGEKVTGITSDTSVWGEIIDLPQWSYIVDASRVSGVFTNKYLYAYENDGRNNDDWPGVAMNSDTIIVPNDATLIIANSTNGTSSTAQTVNITQSFVANDVLRILNHTTDGKYDAVWESTLDEPDEDGYYVVGVDNNWDFDNATQMIYNGGAALDANGNIAICDGITVEAGDEIKVRSFFNEADAWYAPADGQSYTFGAKVSEGDDNSNFRFTTGGTYDVYFKEGYFYLSTHHERHTIGVVDELFTGRTKTSFDNGTSQLAEEGSPFYPASPSRAGYTFINFYTNSACTTLYEAVDIEYDTTLYAKFVKNEAYDDNDGVYVVGDATFTGNVNFAWDIQGAVLLADAVNDTENNLYEGTITIPNSASNENPVQIRPAFYDGSLDYAHATCSLGQAYSFVTKPEDNFVFTRGGVYAVYVNKSLQVYFNTGEDAFYTQFLTEIGAVCNAQGGTDLEALAAAWANQKAAFVALGDAEDTFIYAAGIDAGNESGSDMQKVIAKYKYIVTKYGTAVCEDFIWGETYAATSNNFSLRTVTQNSNVLVITLVTITVVAVGAVSAYALLKKKKER